MGLVQTLVIIGLLIGVGVIALDSVGNSQLTETAGCNSTSGNYTLCPEYLVIANATLGPSKFAQQLPNIGLIGAVSVLLGIVVGGFMLTRGR